MTANLYFSIIPEALLTSMLSPEDFGLYYAVGHQFKTRGQAIFFELDPNFRSDFFNIEEGIKRCVPHADGTPKASVYISTYRVLENVPLEVIRKLYLVTSYGVTLALDPSPELPNDEGGFHMYHELSPVNNLVVSQLGPRNFYESITTKPRKLISFPALCFVDLDLGELAHDPERGDASNLPYENIPHLRECLMELSPKNKVSKMVNRLHSPDFPYRMVKTGLYIGNGEKLMYFAMPPIEKLRRDHYRWWRSAQA